MDWKTEKLYIAVLVQQLEFAAFAYDEIKEGTHYLLLDEVMRRVQAFLSHAACASHVLWPTPTKGERGQQRQERGELLRSRLHVEDASPLGRRQVRNLLEHFDEELDSLLLTLGKRPVVLQSLNGETSTDPQAPIVFKDFNIDNGRLTVLGKSEDLRELRHSIQKVGTEAYRLLNERYVEETKDAVNLLGSFPQRREWIEPVDADSDD